MARTLYRGHTGAITVSYVLKECALKLFIALAVSAMSIPAAADAGNEVVHVLVSRSGKPLIDQPIPVRSSPGQASVKYFDNFRYSVCTASPDGRQQFANGRALRDGASATATRTSKGIALDIVVETVSEEVRAKLKTCQPAPIPPSIQRQRIDLPKDGRPVTIEMPGAVTVVARAS